MAFSRGNTALSVDILLCSMTPKYAQEAGEGLANISPWRDINYESKAIEKYLLAEGSAIYKYAVLYDNALAGVVCVRNPWLKGPYLELLGLFPDYQGKKIGSTIMAWFEKCGDARNLWLVASDFNEDAIAFYQHHGFERTAMLEDLSIDGVHDILMRKKLFSVSS